MFSFFAGLWFTVAIKQQKKFMPYSCWYLVYEEIVSALATNVVNTKCYFSYRMTWKLGLSPRDRSRVKGVLEY